MHRFLVMRVLVGVGLQAVTGVSAYSQTPSPREVLKHFCDIDAQGEQLSPDGRKKVAALFVSPGAPRRTTIIVVRDFVVSLPALEGDGAEFYVEYVELGRIDTSKLSFSSRLPPGIKVRAGFYVVKQPGSGSGAAVEWKIQGPVPEPHLTVDAAIRYVAELRAGAKDVAIRRNVDKTLATLKHFR